MRGKFTRTTSLSRSLLLLSPRPPRIPRWTRTDSEHDDRRPRYLIRLLMRTIYVQCPCLMIQELLWSPVWSEILDLDYLGRGWICFRVMDYDSADHFDLSVYIIWHSSRRGLERSSNLLLRLVVNYLYGVWDDNSNEFSWFYSSINLFFLLTLL